MDLWLEAYRRTWIHETTEEALGFYARIFDQAPAAMMVTEPSFVITDANIAAQQLLKRPLANLRGKPFQRNIAQADRTAFAAIAHEIISSPGRVTRPLLLKTADDGEVEVSLIACAFRDKNDVPEMVMLLLLERGENISSDIL